ncbi:hypothetical protein E6C60_1991 [Paenibacillus algicola]|uniref:PcfJ-like protein n=1 Tax=Paenibacillus algicola TaxID=2565926 RepID=A0A4P8XJB0_9BACL|nr:PcfJ domain-containing protein [Paenibacillus algicola]QCT02706.1 hypothetical protein E6C60_1991 [Paenibacillus algicola]
MMEYKDFTKHFPEKISVQLEKYVTETVLVDSRYLFVKTVSSVQFAYCTHCKKTHQTEKRLRHKQVERAICPKCESKCSIRAAGISRNRMCDYAVLVWYEKSLQDPQAIIARVLNVRRDYSGDFKQVRTEYSCNHMYLFECGRSTYFGYQGNRAQSVYSAFDRFYAGYGNWRRFMSQENVQDAVQGTPFQYSTWEKYTKYRNQDYTSDMIEFFDLAARYPCIEYLTKLGFSTIIWAKLYKEHTCGAINWNGQTIDKVLRLNKSELKELRSLGIELTPRELRTYQKARNSGFRIGFLDAKALSDLEHSIYQDYIKEFQKYTSTKEIYKYVLKQLQLKGSNYRQASTALSDWRDYRLQCLDFNIDLSKEKNLFPKELHTAHMKLTKRLKMKADRELNKKIEARLPELNQYCFEKNGFMIRPAVSTMELFEEGKVLQHCVGGYSDRYALGHTDILFVRRIEDPDKSFYTMEIQKGTLIQCRGYKNKDMSEDVRRFVDSFKLSVLTRKKKSQVKMNNMREVAV